MSLNPLTELPIWLMVIFGTAIALAIIPKLAPKKPAPQFVPKRFLTDNEARVLRFLETALPGHRIMAQVAMGALLDAGETDKTRAHATRNRFAQKMVDFVIVARDTTEVIALIELDDRTHRPAKDVMRDAMTAAAGYRTIRIPSRPRPTAASVRAAVAYLNASPSIGTDPRYHNASIQ